MTCRAFPDIDLASYVAAPSGDEWTAFRDHYPTCAECAASLAEWVPLEDALREIAADHPDDDALLAYTTDGGSLDAESRQRIDAHLEGCAPCRDALTAFRNVQPALSTSAASASPATARARRVWGMSPRTLALAAAAVLLLAWILPTVLRTLRPEPAETPRVAETPPPEEAPAPEPVVAPPLEELMRERPQPETLAVEEPKGAPPEEIPESSPEPERIARPEPAPDLVAARDYVASLPPGGLEYRDAPGLPAGRIGAATRSGMAELGVVPLVPATIGFSHAASPTLRWYQATESAGALVLSVSDPIAMETLHRQRIDGPVRRGFHAASLARSGVRLPAGRDLQWTLTLEDDPGDAAGGVLRRQPAASAVATAGDAATRLQGFAASGHWYDVIDLLARSVERQPENAALREAYAALLESAGLSVPAAELRAGR